jgi:phospholipid/cholesterol/gamma-HCH transport system substrate-binding protein
MPRTRSLAWSELKVGVVTIIAIVITALTIFLLTGSRGFFWQRYNLKTRFGDVAGLGDGSPVRVNGVEVGQVTGVSFVGDEVEISMQVNEIQRERITNRSIATLGSISLLGESAVDISAASSGEPVPEWGYVQSGRARGQLSDVAATAADGLDQINALVRDMREGRGTVGQLMTDDRLYVELQRFATSAGDLTERLKQGRGTIGQLLNDPKAAQALEASLANVETLTRQISEGEGSLGRLIKDDAFVQTLTAATSNLQALTTRLTTSDGTAGKFINDPAVYNQLDSLTDRLDLLIARLNEGEGTAGQLLKDKQLYENMNAAVNDVRALIAAITKDPRKYLTVRVSIF